MRTVAVFVLLLLAPAWLRAGPMEDFQREYGNDGVRYKKALVEAIKTSDRIVVTEHSDRNDFPVSDRNRTDLPQFEYGRVELDGPAKAKFLKNAETIDGKTKTTATSCIFVPHHTVRFYSGVALKSTMQICFYCGAIDWDATRLAPPHGLWTAILPLIEDAGFQTNPEPEYWAQLLKKARKADRRK